MSSFLVLREGDNSNRWRDGQVCPDVGIGIMAPWDRQRRGEKTKRGARPWMEKRKKPSPGPRNMRGEPWLERTGRER
ncbi:hypothetical protein TNCV_1642881 [Trichonephila clavipes]|nr:hypothetical protein TNCV_1642881 [Trichonephila clavipes]